MSTRNRFPFAKCHPGGAVKWLDLTMFERGLLQLLWSLGEVAEDGSCSVIATPGTVKGVASHLTMRLNVQLDRERKNSTRVIGWLLEKGALVVGEGSVSVIGDRALSRRSASTHRTLTGHSQHTHSTLTAHSDTTKPAESFNTASLDRSDRSDRSDQKEEQPVVPVVVPPVLQETKPVPVPEFRRPLPEPPADAVLAPSAMVERIRLAESIESYGERAGRKALGFAPSFHRKQSLLLAEWCLKPENQTDFKLAPRELAKAVCDGLFADEYARERGCTLVLATRNPPGYLRSLKPMQKAPPPPSRQEHQVLGDPDWMRDGNAVSGAEARELGMAALASLLPRLRCAAGAAE
jgi:hypothetical protein